ncbi:hypothetical protein L9F63_002164, partial [Diploptera punctata]
RAQAHTPSIKRSALLQIVEVYKEIQSQQMNILKAFYVDLLVPLETNLEKDTKVVQSEQKRFLQQHKQRSETYSKAAATMKKQRKKNKGTTKTGLAMDKELKNMQVLEEEKSKLDAFCEQSLKTAMTQERRRYGFVLERQCSLAKHYLAYHNQGSTVLQRHLEDWQEVAQTREFLPDSVEVMFNNRLRQVSFWPDEDLYSSPRSPNVEDDRLSIASQLRKTKSMDASCLDMRSINDATSPMKPLSRAKSDFNLTASTHSLVQNPDTPTRPKSMAVPDRGASWDTQLARAMYAYLSSGENQLSFLEGDIIALMGDRNKGWQFGENLRTQCSGWFPLAYTELIIDEASSPTHQRMQSLDSTGSNIAAATPPRPSAAGTPVTMFGDTLLHHRATAAAKQMRRGTTVSASNVGPPPTLPAPVPTPKVPASSTLPVARGVTDRRLIHPPPMPPLPMLGNVKRPPGAIGSGIGNASLHSSNDSGFSNDPPPAPEVDYSDDDSTRKPARRKQTSTTNGAAEGIDTVTTRNLHWTCGTTLPNNKHANSQSESKRPLAMRQSSSVGHLATLGRFNSDKNNSQRNGAMVKRSKSLWRFKRFKDDDILEGMSLWQHRSLVDVHVAVQLEEQTGSSTPTTIKKKSTATNTSLPEDEKPDVSPTPLIRTKLITKIEETQNGHDIPPKPMERKSVKQAAQNGIKTNEYNKRTPPTAPKKPATRNDIDVNDDDGLLIMRSNQEYYSSDEDEVDGIQDDENSDPEGDSESCIVVDDHMKAKISLSRRQQILREAKRGSRFDQVSQTTGNMYGPWYDLWGIDPS